LKQHPTETWSGIQQSVIDQAIDQWQVHFNACVKAKIKPSGKQLWTHAMMCCSTTVNNLLWNLPYSSLCFTTFNQKYFLCTYSIQSAKNHSK